MSSEVAATLMIDRYICNRLTVMMYVGVSYHVPTMHISFLSSFKSSRHMLCIFSHQSHREEALHALMPNVDKMAARQVACQILTSQEFLALDRSMALNLRIQLTLKSLLEGAARYAAINLLNVAQQSVHISPPQLNQPSSSSSSSSPVAVANPSVHMNNNLGAGTGFLNQQQQLISNGYALLSNQVVQESNQVLVGTTTTTATMQQRMPTNHHPTYPSEDSSTRGRDEGTSFFSSGQMNACTSTSEEETLASEDTDTSSDTDHQKTIVDPLHGLNCLADASIFHSKKWGTAKEDGQMKKKKKEGDTKQVQVKKAGKPFTPFRWPPKDRLGNYILPKPDPAEPDSSSKKASTPSSCKKKAREPFRPFRWPPKDRLGNYILPPQSDSSE